ncbi:putative membrane protein YkoI [Rhodoblastus acidophilus]|uniref:PepSY domain-containing protein n=1 Tax=Rhodoblastus acidophilus TaxID=1074 RepID=UPI0022256E9F|nr:hypothetical protein [Rhodoblastus acidophilus]MCW2285803.1 putative membrane protein YkoI [Rhodoblastus acidophilus]MCW2333374.1 putative membrane protein YkoI [Rhodoblastus acidophilus]
MSASPRILLLSIALVAAARGWAESLSPDRARDLVRRGEILSLADALVRLQPAIAGEIMEVALEADGRRFLYRIKALGPDGRYRHLCVDATIGASTNR